MNQKKPPKPGSLPGWIAPIVGAVLGVLLALKAARRADGGGLGLLAGGIVWVIDIVRGNKSDD